MQSAFIYKILTQSEYHEFIKTSFFKGSELDQKDNFIHCSTEDQVSKTREKFFAGLNNLKLLKIDPRGLDVRYESSPRSGITYPHVYEPLPLSNVIEVRDLD